MRVRGAIAAVATLLAIALLPTAAGAASPTDCLTADPPAVTVPPHKVRFGITPMLAGDAGAQQGDVAPESHKQTVAALDELRPEGKQLVLRLNRMFFSDGTKGIHHYADIVEGYARAGFDTELQVRYHPTPAEEGDMHAWRAYVRKAVTILGRRPSVKALSITNEGNLPVSPNTSDGSFEGVRQAVVAGVLAADRKLHRIGRTDIKLGFSVAWRYLPEKDAAFWERIGRLAPERFHRALDYVGMQVYPGLVWPPASLSTDPGADTIEALTLLRGCYMPKAGLGDSVKLWVSENGYPTNLGHSRSSQSAALDSTLDAVHRYSGQLGISDYRYFNLRDNNSDGTGLFDAVGLLTDTYARKPAFGVLRDAIAADGKKR